MKFFQRNFTKYDIKAQKLTIIYNNSEKRLHCLRNGSKNRSYTYIEFFTNFLTLRGEHYALVLVACAELVAAVLLLSLRSHKRVRHAL